MIGRPEAAIAERTTDLEGQLVDFFRAHYDRLVRLAGLVCHSTDGAEDAVQAAMEQAWRRRVTLNDETRLHAWLDRIVVREAIRLNRRPWLARLIRPSDEQLSNVADRSAPGVDPAWIALVQTFRRLPLEQRAAVALHLYAGYLVEETAEMTGASIETTRSRLRLARRKLRDELGEDLT
jgi:RNA polymerase sigma-70 factor (ECF subfamily)